MLYLMAGDLAVGFEAGAIASCRVGAPILVIRAPVGPVTSEVMS
jgi:hypothetical protein